MNRVSIREYGARQQGRYRQADGDEKGRILDEVVAVTGYHRKSAVRLLSGRTRKRKGGRVGRPVEYGPDVAAAARVVHEAAGGIGPGGCNHSWERWRLAAFGELEIDPATDALLRRASAATLERLLAAEQVPVRKRTASLIKPGTLLRNRIAVRTPYRVRGRLFRDWDDASPGFVEVDTVAHCGPTVEGFHLWTVTAVDVATRWVEMDVVWGKTQERVGAAIRRMHRRLPVPLLGLDSDNGSEFINRGLYSYCEENGITFTKSRPYRENDSAHVERKKVYSLARLHVNFFQPVRRLTGRSGHGARVIRQHDEASTPYQRMLSSRAVSRTKQMLLEKMYLSLNPLWLSRQIDAENDKLLGMAWRQGKPLSRNTAGNRNCEVNSLAR